MSTKKINIISKKASALMLFLLLILFSFNGAAENLKPIANLEGSWKFTVGDDLAWASPGYDDRDWDYVRVPGSWESNGFINYNGYGWYRKNFTLHGQIDETYLFLMLGYVDDVDEVYINGHLVGSSGVFPPLVHTAYNILRKYPVPTEILNENGKNLIAVRVFDDYHNGGITAGPVGLYFDKDNEMLSQNLSGYWDFETTNYYPSAHPGVYGKEESMIFVPGLWETQGYLEYDGSATYTHNFKLARNITPGDELMLVLGYIDDIDKVYLNGEKIGSIEMISKDRNKNTYYREFRGYKIPEGLLSFSSDNILVVKVYDTQGLGGIYAGPIGLATAENFNKLKKSQKPPPEPSWYDLFKYMFD